MFAALGRRSLVATVIVLASFVLARPASAAIVHVGGNVSACAFGASCTVTYTSTTGNLVYVYATASANTTFTISDTAGNSYTALANSAGSGGGVGFWRAYYKANATGATSFTVTPGASANLVIDVEEYSGVATAFALDAEATRGACFSGCGTSLSATAWTTSATGDVAVCSYAADSAVSAFSAGTIGGTGATEERTVSGGGGFSGVEDLVLAGTLSSATATATATGTPGVWFMGCAAFKPSGAPAVPGCRGTLLLMGAGCDEMVAPDPGGAGRR